MKKNHNDCLILNSDYSPLCIIDWQKSMVWYYRSQYTNNRYIEIISFHENDTVVGAKNKFEIPSVIRILKYLNFANKSVKFSRRNLFIRDNFTCQYCGKKNDTSQLTYDHVIPKSKWTHNHSPTNWYNIVTACTICNRKKANRTPELANMPLINSPIKPTKNVKYLPIATYLSSINNNVPPDWKLYLPSLQLN